MVPVWGRGTARCAERGRGAAISMCARMSDTSQTLPLALIGCVDPEQWMLANQIRATGWSHRQCVFIQLNCILLYCQIMMTILANITKIVYYYITLIIRGQQSDSTMWQFNTMWCQPNFVDVMMHELVKFVDFICKTKLLKNSCHIFPQSKFERYSV